MDKPKKKRPGEGDRERRPSKYGEGGRAVGGQARRAAFKKIIPQQIKKPIGVKDVPEPGAQPDFLLEEAKAVGKEPSKNSAFNKLKLLQASINSRKGITQNTSSDAIGEDPISPDILEELFPKVGEKERPIQSREERKKRTKKQVERRPILRIATETEDDDHEILESCEEEAGAVAARTRSAQAEKGITNEICLAGGEDSGRNRAKDSKASFGREAIEDGEDDSNAELGTESRPSPKGDNLRGLSGFRAGGNGGDDGEVQGEVKTIRGRRDVTDQGSESGARDCAEDKVDGKANTGSNSKLGLGKLARRSPDGGDRTFRGNGGGLSGTEEGTGVDDSYVHFAQEEEVDGRFTALYPIAEGMGEDAQGEVNDPVSSERRYVSESDGYVEKISSKKDKSVAYTGARPKEKTSREVKEGNARGINGNRSLGNEEQETAEAEDDMVSSVSCASENGGNYNLEFGSERLCANAQEDAEADENGTRIGQRDVGDSHAHERSIRGRSKHTNRDSTSGEEEQGCSDNDDLQIAQRTRGEVQDKDIQRTGAIGTGEEIDGAYDSSYDGIGARGSEQRSISGTLVEEESLSGGEGDTLRKNNSRGRTNQQGRNQRGHTTGKGRDREGTVEDDRGDDTTGDREFVHRDQGREADTFVSGRDARANQKNRASRRSQEERFVKNGRGLDEGRDGELSTEDGSFRLHPVGENSSLSIRSRTGNPPASTLSTVPKSELKAPEKKHLPIFTQDSPVRPSITPYSPSVLVGVAALLDLPGAICDNCPLGEDKCPKFQLGSTCYYEENMEALPVRDRESFLPLMEHFAQIDVKRATRAVMIEQRATGQVANDPAVTRLIEKAQRSLRELEEIKTPIREQAERSITVIAKESGPAAPAQKGNLIQALMSSLSPPKSLPPAQESNIITIEPEHVSVLTDD
jgi:hypothetical protein